jgi:AcrR family transcriptional regulator
MGIPERKQREFRRREREILDAALELFAIDDWQAVTVEQIAERAEIGKGTVYKHFESKDEIYARLAAEFQAAALQRIEAIDPTLSVIQRLRCIIEVVWEQHERAAAHQPLLQYCERDDFRRSLSPEAQASLAGLDAKLGSAIDRVLQDGIDEGILPAKPLSSLVFGPMAALRGALRLLWLDPQPAARRQEYLTEITNFILAGMLYQEWLAEEGLDDDEAVRRAERELAEIEAPLDGDRAEGRHV